MKPKVYTYITRIPRNWKTFLAMILQWDLEETLEILGNEETFIIEKKTKKA